MESVGPAGWGPRWVVGKDGQRHHMGDLPKRGGETAKRISCRAGERGSVLTAWQGAVRWWRFKQQGKEEAGRHVWQAGGARGWKAGRWEPSVGSVEGEG